MVPFKNVTVTASPIVQSELSDDTLDNPTPSSPATGIQGYLEEWDAMEVWETYNVRLVNPAVIQVEVADAANIPPESEIAVTSQEQGSGSYVGRVYKVHGRGDWHDDGLQTDHVSFLLDRMTYPL